MLQAGQRAAPGASAAKGRSPTSAGESPRGAGAPQPHARDVPGGVVDRQHERRGLAVHARHRRVDEACGQTVITATPLPHRSARSLSSQLNRGGFGCTVSAHPRQPARVGDAGDPDKRAAAGDAHRLGEREEGGRQARGIDREQPLALRHLAWHRALSVAIDTPVWAITTSGAPRPAMSSFAAPFTAPWLVTSKM